MYLARKFWPGILRDCYTKHHNGWFVAGFSFVEVLIVLAIISILAFSLLAPANQIIEEIGLRQMAIMLARDIRYIQQQTIQEPNANWQLQFADNQSWQVSRNNVIQYTRVLPNGILMNGIDNIPNRQFSFRETGQPVNAGTVFLNNRYSVAIMGFTGRIRWAKL